MQTLSRENPLPHDWVQLYPSLRATLSTRDIRTLFQPIVRFRDGSIYGYEALSRGPAETLLESPTVLFAVAEELGLLWELETLCRQLAIQRFTAQETPGLLFLNADPRIVEDPRFREGMMRNQLAQTALPADRIVLEITERAVIANGPDFLRALEHFKQMGFRVAVDDAGAGYSGLHLICQVRPRYLKLDMGLIQGIARDSFKQQLVKFTVDLARATDMRIIGEGIETEEDLLTLIELGVEYGQGYLFGRPQPTPQRAAERCVQLCRAHGQRLAHRRSRVACARVGDNCRTVSTVHPQMTCREVEDLFTRDEKLLALPVVAEGKTVGLIMREKFFMRMATRYGYSLFQNRPLSYVMDPQPLCVDFHTDLETVAQAAMQRDPAAVYDEIIIQVHGSYFGTIAVSELLECIMQQGLRYAQYANPLTGLPGNVMIQQEIESMLGNGDPFTVLYLDLDNFKAYNDVYGFDRGDEVLVFTAELLQEAFPPQPIADPFIGHIGGDDFVVVIPTACPDARLHALLDDFDRRIRRHYSEVHRQQGQIEAVNRRGEVEQFPFISLSIAVITAENGPFENYHEVAKRATEVKKACKMTRGSCAVRDRRRDQPDLGG